MPSGNDSVLEAPPLSFSLAERPSPEGKKQRWRGKKISEKFQGDDPEWPFPFVKHALAQRAYSPEREQAGIEKEVSFVWPEKDVGEPGETVYYDHKSRDENPSDVTYGKWTCCHASEDAAPCKHRESHTRDILKCVQCGILYKANENYNQACSYHKGDIKLFNEYGYYEWGCCGLTGLRGSKYHSFSGAIADREERRNQRYGCPGVLSKHVPEFPNEDQCGLCGNQFSGSCEFHEGVWAPFIKVRHFVKPPATGTDTSVEEVAHHNRDHRQYIVPQIAPNIPMVHLTASPAFPDEKAGPGARRAVSGDFLYPKIAAPGGQEAIYAARGVFHTMSTKNTGRLSEKEYKIGTKSTGRADVVKGMWTCCRSYIKNGSECVRRRQHPPTRKQMRCLSCNATYTDDATNVPKLQHHKVGAPILKNHLGHVVWECCNTMGLEYTRFHSHEIKTIRDISFNSRFGCLKEKHYPKFVPETCGHCGRARSHDVCCPAAPCAMCGKAYGKNSTGIDDYEDEDDDAFVKGSEGKEDGGSAVSEIDKYYRCKYHPGEWSEFTKLRLIFSSVPGPPPIPLTKLRKKQKSSKPIPSQPKEMPKRAMPPPMPELVYPGSHPEGWKASKPIMEWMIAMPYKNFIPPPDQYSIAILTEGPSKPKEQPTSIESIWLQMVPPVPTMKDIQRRDPPLGGAPKLEGFVKKPMMYRWRVKDPSIKRKLLPIPPPPAAPDHPRLWKTCKKEGTEIFAEEKEPLVLYIPPPIPGAKIISKDVKRFLLEEDKDKPNRNRRRSTHASTFMTGGSILVNGRKVCVCCLGEGCSVCSKGGCCHCSLTKVPIKTCGARCFFCGKIPEHTRKPFEVEGYQQHEAILSSHFSLCETRPDPRQNDCVGHTIVMRKWEHIEMIPLKMPLPFPPPMPQPFEHDERPCRAHFEFKEPLVRGPPAPKEFVMPPHIRDAPDIDIIEPVASTYRPPPPEAKDPEAFRKPGKTFPEILPSAVPIHIDMKPHKKMKRVPKGPKEPFVPSHSFTTCSFYCLHRAYDGYVPEYEKKDKFGREPFNNRLWDHRYSEREWKKMAPGRNMTKPVAVNENPYTNSPKIERNSWMMMTPVSVHWKDMTTAEREELQKRVPEESWFPRAPLGFVSPDKAGVLPSAWAAYDNDVKSHPEERFEMINPCLQPHYNPNMDLGEEHTILLPGGQSPLRMELYSATTSNVSPTGKFDKKRKQLRYGDEGHESIRTLDSGKDMHIDAPRPATAHSAKPSKQLETPFSSLRDYSDRFLYDINSMLGDGDSKKPRKGSMLPSPSRHGGIERTPKTKRPKSAGRLGPGRKEKVSLLDRAPKGAFLV